MSEKEDLGSKENRQYVRLPEPLPVEFTIVRLQGDLPGLDWARGVTRNVSRGGLCLETKELSEAMIKYLAHENIYLDLRMSLPFQSPSIKAVGDIVWYRQDAGDPKIFLIGVKFRSIIAKDLNQILRYARVISFSTRSLIWLSIAILGFIMALNIIRLTW